MADSTTSKLLIVALALTVAAAAACGRTSTVSTTFTVEGMTCESCSAAITDALMKVEGVEQASADHLTGSARAIHLSPDVPTDRLAAEIEGLGYTVTAVASAPVGD
jgi:copper chaperone CopZ